MRELVSTPVQHLVVAHPSDLLTQIQTASHTRRIWPWAAAVLAILALIAAPYSLALLLPGVPAVLWLRQRDIPRRSVVVFYQVEDAPAAKYEHFTGSSGFVSPVQRVWQVEAEGALHTPYQRKVNAGASRLIQRRAGSVDHIAVPSIHGTDRSIYFLPYSAVSAHMQPQRFIESEPPPTDAQCVDTTWQYTNKSGGPDRRFKNNRQLPVMLYGRLTLTTPQGLLMVWDLSRPDVAASLAEALDRMR